jgi:hypothetical protein
MAITALSRTWFFFPFNLGTDGELTNQQTNQPTNGPTNGQTTKTSALSICPHIVSPQETRMMVAHNQMPVAAHLVATPEMPVQLASFPQNL